jgi:type II secretory pathway component PulM
MAAGAPKSSSSGELSQILFLTLVMTGGGLSLLYLVFGFWLVPDKRRLSDDAAREYERFTKLLLSDDMQGLKSQAKVQDEASNESAILQNIANEKAQTFGLRLQSVSPPTKDGNAEAVTVKIDPASLSAILMYVADVRAAKKTIEVAGINLNRGSRRGRTDAAAETLFSATVDFLDYSPPKT